MNHPLANRAGILTDESQLEASDELVSNSRSNDRVTTSTPASHSRDSPARMHCRRGKAPPLNCFSGENPKITFEDWLPSLERGARWNEWPEEDTLIQLTGHLRGRALKEWLLLAPEAKKTFQTATLTAKLETRSKVLAAQDFRHLRQKEKESVADFIYCMEKEFHIAYCNDSLSRETREAFLYGQLQDGLHPVSCASRPLSLAERNYGITDLETLAVIWTISHFRHYLYNQHIKICTDYIAVKSVLLNPNISGKHARWWTKVFGSGLKSVDIVHGAGRKNSNADALSRDPRGSASSEGLGESKVQVAIVRDNVVDEKSVLPQLTPCKDDIGPAVLAMEQKKDQHVVKLFNHIESGKLPGDKQRACKIVSQARLFGINNNVLYYSDPEHKSRRRVVVPISLREKLITSTHGGPLAGHFSNNRLYNLLVQSWWWNGMYADVAEHCRRCPQCIFASGGESTGTPPLQPIPVQTPFQIVGIDGPATDRERQ